MKKQTVISIGAALVMLSVLGVYLASARAAGPEAAATPAPTTVITNAAATEKSQPSITPYAKQGSKAEAILREVLTKKQMTDNEAAAYNEAPETIKELTYEEARAKQEVLYETVYGAGRAESHKNGLTEELAAQLTEYWRLKQYADAIATGWELCKVEQTRLLSETNIGNADLVYLEQAIEQCDPVEFAFIRKQNEEKLARKRAFFPFIFAVLENYSEKITARQGSPEQMVAELRLLRSFILKSSGGDYLPVADTQAFSKAYQQGTGLESILNSYTVIPVDFYD